MNVMCCGKRMTSLPRGQYKFPYIKALRKKYPGLSLKTGKFIADTHAPYFCVWQCSKCKKIRTQALRRSAKAIAVEKQAIDEAVSQIVCGILTGVIVDGVLVVAYQDHATAVKAATRITGSVTQLITVIVDRNF